MTVNSVEQKTVLVVDDDVTLLESIRICLEKLENIRCILASNGIEGLEKIRTNRVHLLITDLQMPGMDGITFLSHMMEEFPYIPRVVMTSMGTKSRKYAEQTGVIAVLSKPIDIKTLPENVKRWLSLYQPHTVTEGVDLSSLMQLISLDRKTGTVGVQDKRNGRLGLMHILDGEMVDASTGNMRGMEAAMNILQWPDVRIWMHDLATPSEVTIEAPIQAILMNAACYRDEETAGEETGDAADIPTAQWIRENRPSEVNIETPVTSEELPFAGTDASLQEEIATSGNEKQDELAPSPFLSRENKFLAEVAESLKKNNVAAGTLDAFFDEAISAFRAKDYETSRAIWLKARELAPDHPVIKQNLKIVEKYL